MTRNWSWKAGVSSGLTISVLFWADCGVAQLRPMADNTLGEERSMVSSFEVDGMPGDRITGGARRGNNLFHSFQEFSIDQGQAAYFANPAGVENILGRVTGGGQSEILGRLGVLGEANLFLLNLNGIVFGPNSSLDIGGAFVASTADALGFGEQGWFSATTPEAPSPLLTINPTAFFFNQVAIGDITVRSTVPIDPALGTVGLSVGLGENLALLGGDIMVEGGGLNAPGGRIDLGAVEGAGTIGLNTDGSFAFPTEAPRGDIVFIEAARADVRTSERNGEIAITAQRISFTGGSRLRAGILPEQGSPGSQAGNIGLDAAEQILMSQSSVISNAVFSNSQGNAGNIEITTPILEILDGATLLTITFGQGDAGSAIITASNRVTFNGGDAFSLVEETGIGNGGDIVITTPILEVLNGAQLIANTEGQGDAGGVIITASDHVTFRQGSAAFSSIESGGRGAEGGGIMITTPILEMLDGAQLITDTDGQGDAGNVIIIAKDRVTFQGVSRDGRFSSGALSRVEKTGIGKGGDIEITSPVLEMLDGTQLSASTFGQGDAGRVIITVSDRVLLDGVGSNGFSSGLFTDTSSSALGSGGKVIVTTPQLQIANGAVINARTENVQSGGDILIEADQVTAVGGGQVITTTSGSGRAGNITINADRIHLSGLDPTFTQRLEEFGPEITENEREGESGLFANTRPDSTGAGGEITLNTTDLIVSDQAQITAQSQGSGAAGEVTIRAREAIILDSHGSINSDTSGGQGDIDLVTSLLLLQDNSTITTNASGLATGGNIDINADFIVATANENSDIFANAFQGSGGQINLTALAIFGLEFRTRAELQQLLGDNPADLTPRNLPSNDVTAFSQTSPNLDVGTVTFRTPDVDPSQGLVELPIAPLIAADRIVSICPTDGGRTATSLQGEFTVTGRGGLPANPLTPFNGDTVLADWATLDDQPNNTPISPPDPTMTTPPERAIVEATGWSRDAAGNIVLIAAAAQSPFANPIQCQ